jgi:hypothetical protein
MFYSVESRLMSMTNCYKNTERGNPKYSEKNMSQCKLARTGRAARDLGLNAGF